MYSEFIQKELPFITVEFNNSLKKTAPIIAKNLYSYLLGMQTVNSSFAAAGDEKTSLSIECWLCPLGITDVINHVNAGISWNGSIDYRMRVNGEDVTVSYTPPVNKSYYVVGVYTATGMILYVDAVQVASIAFEDEVTSSWISSNSFTIGSSDSNAIIDGIAIYKRELSSKEIKSHLDLGYLIDPITTNLTWLDATTINLENQRNYLCASQSWGVEDNWSDGTFTNCYVDGTYLVGVAGAEWQGAFTLDEFNEIKKSKISWDKDADVTVSVSVDFGTTWIDVSSNSYIPNIETLGPRIVTARIIFNSDSQIDYLSIDLYNSLNYITNQMFERSTYFSNGNHISADEAYDQLRYRKDRGTYFAGTSKLSIDPPVTDQKVYAIDLWYRAGAVGELIRFQSGEYISTTQISGGTAKYNNQTSYAPVDGEWVHLLFKLNTPSAAKIEIAPNGFIGQIGSVHTYPKSVDGQESRIYASYFGGEVEQIDELSEISIVEDTNSWDIYSYDWTSTSF